MSLAYRWDKKAITVNTIDFSFNYGWKLIMLRLIIERIMFAIKCITEYILLFKKDIWYLVSFHEEKGHENFQFSPPHGSELNLEYKTCNGKFRVGT